MESSDEDEENIKNDNLNCAILNDSFLLSPGGKSDRDDASSKESSAIKSHNDTSLLVHFGKMGLNTNIKENANTLNNKIPEILVNGPAEEIIANSKIINTAELDTPIKSENASKEVAVGTEVKAASSNIEAQFATPQIRSFSVRRRPRDLCSTQTQKARSAIVSEFRSQKVLFQTPMAISRAPIPNDSISLSLCDTINEVETPSTAEKTPQCTDSIPSIDASGRYKKSLVEAFNDVDKEQPKDTVKKTDTTSSAAVTTNKEKETVVHINKGSYVILQKLGCGGSSSVYSAKRQDNGKECALKVTLYRMF